MTPDLRTPVLVAGGGPFGLMLACELGRRGVPLLLVDPKPGTAFNPQANATQARTMEHFRRLGIAQRIREQGLPADHPSDIAYFTRLADHELARLTLPTAAEAVRAIKTLGGSWSAAELPHRISQKYVEATLLEQASSHPTNDLRYGWRLVDFEQDADGVTARIEPTEGGAPLTVRADYLIGGDGARSPIRKALGIAWGGATGARRDFMGGQMFAVYMRSPAFYEVFPHRQAWMYVAVNAQRRGFICSVDGRGEFAFHAAMREGENADDWGHEEAQALFAQIVGRELPIEVLSVGTWTAGHSLVADSFGNARVWIGGDAAHLFTPTGGLGYNTAVEDAVNMAWKLEHVLRGISPATLMDTYHTERHALAVRNTGYARQFADSVGLLRATPQLEEDSEAGRAERERVGALLNAHVRLEFNIPGVTFGGRYDASPLVVGDGSAPPPDDAGVYIPSACPGGRPPHAWLADGRSLYDSFGPDWTLLRLGRDAPAASGFASAADSLRLSLQVVSHADDSLRALYEAPLALVRPDQMVAWRGTDDAQAMAVLRQACGAA